MSGKDRRLHFDPRVKLFIVLLCGIFTFLADKTGLLLLLSLMTVYLLVQGTHKKTLKYLLAFALLYGLQYVINSCFSELAAILGFIVFYVARFIPVLMAASALSETGPGELIAALQKLHIPKAVIIPLAVGLRFMPCISKEFSSIRDAMRLRGISLTSSNTLAHPAMTIECVFVPLLIRSMKISDELAASATVRGIDNPGPRTCLRQLHFGLSDGIALLAFCALGITTGIFFT